MTTAISRPPENKTDVDMQVDCESAIDVPVREFIDAIIQAGWSPEIAYAAMKSVVENQTLAYAEDPDPADDPA